MSPICIGDVFPLIALPWDFALCSLLLDNGSPLTERCAVFQVAKAVSHSLNNCVNCLPGQKDVDMALRSIGEASKKLLVDIVSPAHRFYLEIS